MAIRSRSNQYQGINAHFQSYAQHERDGWSTFHSHHLGHLSEAIDNLLPPGYEVSIEKSLQIRTHDPDTGKPITRSPAPDVAIWDTDLTADRSKIAHQGISASPVATRPVIETMVRQREDYLKAVVIKEITPDGERIAVTRLELLSPTNKIGDDAKSYLSKRDTTLESGTVLVEIDYLHETNSPIPGIPGYANRAPDAYPYMIMVSDPRPLLEIGQASIYGFRVDEIMPPIAIPLTGDESILLNFATVYNHTFSSLSTYPNRADYSQTPLAFESYLPIDQVRIWARQLAVLDAEKRGIDLDQAPFPALADDPALLQLQQHGYDRACLLIDENQLTVRWLIQHQNTLKLLHRTDPPTLEMILAGSADVVSKAYQALKSAFETQGLAAFTQTLQGYAGDKPT